MNKYKETFKTWNKVATLYEEKFMNLTIYNGSYDVFCNLLKPNATILELGCGPGNISKYLLLKNNTYQIIGIDIAPKMIEKARKNNISAKYKLMDIRRIDKIEQNFNGVICGFSLPYLSDVDCRNLFKNSRNLLNDNGILYLSFVAGDYKKSNFKTDRNGDRMYFYYHETKKIIKELKAHHFKIEKKIEIDYTSNEVHTVLIAKKQLEN